jgi:prepilin-type processing-associated H-X9-DG protein
VNWRLDNYHRKWTHPSYAYWFTGLRHLKKSNYLFADGHVKLLSLRQTLTPEVLWDRIDSWCPGCTCYKRPWTPQDITALLKRLDDAGYP